MTNHTVEGRRIAELEQQLAESQRREALLRDAVNTAKDEMSAAYEKLSSIPDICGTNNVASELLSCIVAIDFLQTEIDGGALGGGGKAVCHWVDSNDDYWQTDCGQAWTLIADGPVENGMNYCPKCGRPLVVETAVSEQTEEDDND